MTGYLQNKYIELHEFSHRTLETIENISAIQEEDDGCRIYTRSPEKSYLVEDSYDAVKERLVSTAIKFSDI